MQPVDAPGRSPWVDRIPVRGTARAVAVAVPTLLAATALVWLLEERLGVLNASPVYLLAVVATALVAGTAGALVSAVAGILLYDYLFTHPLHTLTISDPGEWLNLVLLLFVGLVVGQLTALERTRTETAAAREREARELFQISRVLATRPSTPAVLGEIAELLRAATGMRSLWVALGGDDASERVAAEVGDRRSDGAGFGYVLRRAPGTEPARWIRVHSSSLPASALRAERAGERSDLFRVRIEAGEELLGSIWSRRVRREGLPDRSATRLLAAAADQVGQALSQDRLAAEARAAEIARQSDALKSALLQSVSHDLRTPLAAIRAAAGTLRPDSGLDAAGRRASADTIEREVEFLDRIVANLLDLSRIEAGAIRAERDVFELDDLAGRTLDRLAPRLAARPVTVDLASTPVLVDPVFLDEALTNLVDNALKFAGPEQAIVIRSEADQSANLVRLVVEDAGPGVSDADLPHLFEKFYRAPTSRARPGTGIGLAVVKGLIEAMGGAVHARRSPLGGLAIELDLPLAVVPAELVGPVTA